MKEAKRAGVGGNKAGVLINSQLDGEEETLRKRWVSWSAHWPRRRNVYEKKKEINKEAEGKSENDMSRDSRDTREAKVVLFLWERRANSSREDCTPSIRMIRDRYGASHTTEIAQWEWTRARSHGIPII